MGLGDMNPNTVYSMSIGQWYRTNKKDFDIVAELIRTLARDSESYNESVDSVRNQFEKHTKLYIRVMNNPLRFNYRSDFNEFYMGTFMELSDLIPNMPKVSRDTVKITPIDDDIIDTIIGYTPDNKPVYANKKENKENKVMYNEKLDAIFNLVNEYKNKKSKEIEAEADESIAVVKANDPIRKVIDPLQKAVNDNREAAGLYKVNLEEYVVYSKDTIEALSTLAIVRKNKYKQLDDIVTRVINLCGICDTYEQAKEVLEEYKIIEKLNTNITRLDVEKSCRNKKKGAK